MSFSNGQTVPVDWGRDPGRIMSNVTLLGVRVGDRISFPGDPNAVRRIVTAMPDSNAFEYVRHVKGSKGWRRHVRRAKQKKSPRRMNAEG